MYSIGKEITDEIVIDKCQWGYDKYKPFVTLNLSYDDSGFNVLFNISETNPLREKVEHFSLVHEDSCVELFLNFSPKTSDRYMNFEVNANGVMNVAFRKDRHDKINLTLQDVESFNVSAKVFDDYWTVSYKVGFDFLKKYYPDFDINTCDYIIGNAYKCGDETKIPHYMSLFDVKCEKPDFHRPEYFGRFEIAK